MWLAGKWIEAETIMLRKISKIQKNIHHVYIYMWILKKNKTHLK
jgi:hypothetical protein